MAHTPNSAVKIGQDHHGQNLAHPTRPNSARHIVFPGPYVRHAERSPVPIHRSASNHSRKQLGNPCDGIHVNPAGIGQWVWEKRFALRFLRRATVGGKYRRERRNRSASHRARLFGFNPLSPCVIALLGRQEMFNKSAPKFRSQEVSRTRGTRTPFRCILCFWGEFEVRRHILFAPIEY